MKKYLFSVGTVLILLIANCELYRHFKNVELSIVFFLLSIGIAFYLDILDKKNKK